MTRAETLAAIKENLAIWTSWNGGTHWDDCVTDPRHRECAIAWLLQEIEYLNAKIDAANAIIDMALGVKR